MYNLITSNESTFNVYPFANFHRCDWRFL